MAFLLLILQRARQHWQILLTLGLGVILTTALLASGPLVVDTVIEMGLQLTFRGASVTDAHLRLTTSTAVDQAASQALDGEIRSTLQPSLAEHLNRVILSAESPWLFPWVGDQLVPDQRVNLRYYQEIQDHIEYTGGRWPEEASDEPDVIRAIISDGMARTFALRVGDRLPLSLNQESDEPDIWIEVAGVARPQNPRDPFWFGEFNPLISSSTQDWSVQYSVVLAPDTFYSATASLFPDAEIELAWHALLQHEAFLAAEIDPFQTQLADLEGQLGDLEPPVTLYTNLPQVLTRFQHQIESIRVPLYILIAEVMLLVVYYVTMVSALWMRQVEREFAIMRGRGARSGQIIRIQLVEALLILAVALLVGPGLGVVLVRGLSWMGPLADMELAGWSPTLSQSAWQAAGIGALACMAGLLLPIGPMLRRSIVTHQQMMARSTRPPWWQRLYLDVFLMAGGLVLLWRLRLYGEMTTGGPGGTRLDWLLLLSPVALLLGAATILLRVFPLILRALASLAARRRGLAGVLALWQASRNPTHVARLVLLLTLAISLGNLSTGLNATLDQSEYDRAYYLAGNDLRMISQQAIPLVDLQSAPGVVQLSGAWRGEGAVALEAIEMNPAFEVLAIEPGSFAQVTTYRDDYADRDMDELLGHLTIPEGEHPSLLLLPGQPARFGLWAWGSPEYKAAMDSYRRWIDGDSDAERVGIVAKLQTAQGELFTVALPRLETTEQAALQTDRFSAHLTIGDRDVGLNFRMRPDTGGWYYFEGSLPTLPPSSYPLSLHSLWFENQATRLGEPIPNGVGLVLDDLTVVDAETQAVQVVEDFDSLDRTVFLNIMAEGSIWVGLITYATNDVSHSGDFGQAVSMWFGESGQTYALRLRQVWASEPLPALASPAFMEATELEVGDVARAWVNSAEVDFRIAGTVRNFPTMYEEMEAGYLVTSRDLLLALFNETSQQSTNPNEVLIETDGSTSIDTLSSLVPMLTESWRAESVRQALKANPLALGLRSVTFFGSALTILLSYVGFATHFYMTARQREALYGVMRAMGMSARQLYGSIIVEQAILVLTGLALGTGLGVLLNQVTLPRLPVSLGDRPPVPPFVPRADWLAIAWLCILFAIASLIMLGIVTALLWRARLHRILRVGQE